MEKSKEIILSNQEEMRCIKRVEDKLKELTEEVVLSNQRRIRKMRILLDILVEAEDKTNQKGADVSYFKRITDQLARLANDMQMSWKVADQLNQISNNIRVEVCNDSNF